MIRLTLCFHRSCEQHSDNKVLVKVLYRARGTCWEDEWVEVTVLPKANKNLFLPEGLQSYQCDIRSKVERHTKKKAVLHPCTTHVRTCLYRLQDTWLSAIATFKRNSIILIIPIATDQCFPRSRNFSEYLKYVGRAYKNNNNNKRQYECMFFGRTVLYCFNSLHIWLIDCTHKSDKNKHCYSSNLVLEFSSTWHTPWIEGKSQNTWQYTVALKVTIKVCQNIKFVPFMGTW